MKPTTEQLLYVAKARITDPDNWCKGASAFTSNGRPVGVSDPNACKWCSYGALAYAHDVTSLEQECEAEFVNADVLLRRAANVGGSYIEFNDRPSTTHSDVMRMFDKAIELAYKQKEKRK